MKQVVCLLNGITDVELRDLGGETPLQKARHPALDRMAQEGACRLGLPPAHGGFEAGLLALFGIDRPITLGALEAHAVGLKLMKGEKAYCLRLVGLGADTVVDVADDLVGDQEGRALCQLLETTWHLPVVHLSGPCGLVVVTTDAGPGKRQSPAAAVGTPWRKLVPKKLWTMVQAGQSAIAETEINALKRELGEQPADGIWLFGGGCTEAMPLEDRWLLGAKSAATCGVGRLLGWEVRQIPNDPGDIVEWIVGCGAEQVMVEVPHIWESTYKGDLLEKIKRIEWLDRHLVAPLMQSGVELTLLPTKHTDIRAGEPVSGPVPIVQYPVSGVKRPRFSEAAFAGLISQPLGTVLSPRSLV